MTHSKYISTCLRTAAVSLAMLCLFQIGGLGQDNSTAKKPSVPEVFWGKTVLRKELERKRDLGGGFEFRSMAYYMDCSQSFCVENPWHIGELWSASRLLGRGLSGPYSCSASPSKRFILFETVEGFYERVKLFDHNSGMLIDVTDKIRGDPSVPESKWNEETHELSVTYYKDRKLIASPITIKLPK